MESTVLRFLVVEDEVITAMCLEMELKRAGYTVCQRVVSGEEAVASAVQHRPDVVLMDIRLAGKLDGIEAAQEIQTATGIPVIFMTGYPDDAVIARANQLNPLGFFIKPVKIHNIQAVLETLA